MPDTFTFEDKSKRMVRVIFEPDGTPLFCGSDIATLAGYKATGAAIKKDRSGVETVMRRIWWANSEKRGCVSMHFFTAENARLFLQKKPVQTEDVKWFLITVIPDAEIIGRQRAASKAEADKAAADMEIAEGKSQLTAHSEQPNLIDRLDAIILECALLKKELRQTK